MTESEQIDYLAKNIMQWHEKISPTYTGENIDWFDAHEKWVARKQNGSTLWQESIIAWNPLHSWDCFRQVEEKVMEDEKLWIDFISVIWTIKPEKYPKKIVRHVYDTLAIVTMMQAHITLDPNVRQKKKERIEAQDNYAARVALYNHANNAVDSAKKYYNAGTPDSEIEVLPELFSPSLT